MAFKYDEVVPWGRNLDEYQRMFDLKDYTLKILGCGDGPASFNEEYTQKGGKIISIDPIYHLSQNEIQKRINKTCLNPVASRIWSTFWASFRR